MALWPYLHCHGLHCEIKAEEPSESIDVLCVLNRCVLVFDFGGPAGGWLTTCQCVRGHVMMGAT
eukprot:177970-Rhodomonas_salina.4